MLLCIHRGCSSLFSAVRGIQKLDLSDVVARDDAMQAVALLSNLNTLNLAYSGNSFCRQYNNKNSLQAFQLILGQVPTGVPES